MVARAAVRTITAYAGTEAPKDRIQLLVDQKEVHVGSEITGSIVVCGHAPVKSVLLTFEGTEHTVVALPRTDDNRMGGMEYLKKNTSETRCIIKQEATIDCTQPKRFKFAVPKGIPTTMRCRIDDTDPMLPSQCQVKYTVTATMYKNTSKNQVSYPVCVLPQKVPEDPVDSSLSVAIGSSMDVLFQSLFSCGGSTCLVSDGEEPIVYDNYILLEPSVETLHLSAGQPLKVKVHDWFGLFKESKHNWMIRVKESLTWKAQGRTANSRQTFDILANDEDLPSTLRRTYDQDSESLLQVSHEIVVFAASKDNPKEILATTEPIPVQIVSSSRGWDI